jgi:hypothetical protein
VFVVVVFVVVVEEVVVEEVVVEEVVVEKVMVVEEKVVCTCSTSCCRMTRTRRSSLAGAVCKAGLMRENREGETGV